MRQAPAAAEVTPASAREVEPAAPAEVSPEVAAEIRVEGDEHLGEPRGNPFLAVALTWLLPGLGHAYLGRWRRGLAFGAMMGLLIWVGAALQGPLWGFVLPLPGGHGLPVESEILSLPLVVLGLSGHEGIVTYRGYEYGMTYLLTASICSLLLMFDAWDVSRGHKP